VLVGGIVLLVPLAMIVRPVPDDAARVETDGLPGAVVLVQPGATQAVAPATTMTALVSTFPVYRSGAVADSSASAPSISVGGASVYANAVEAAAVTTTTAPPTTAAAVTAAPTTATPATSPPTTKATTTTVACGQDYEVVAGDSWSGIASSYGLGLGELLAVNGASASTALYPGSDICLPPGAQRRVTTTAAPATTKAPATTAAPATTRAPATTAAPATTQAPATTVPSRSYSNAEVEAIIRAVWPDDLEDKALQVAWRESTYKPTARNSCCYGLFQIHWTAHRSWLDDWGITSAAQLYDPTLNAQVAVAVYERAGGWGPWGG
jgi:LysM repeat protein